MDSNIGNVLVDSIPGFVVGGILGFIGLGGYNLITNSSKPVKQAIVYNSEHLSFQPILFHVDTSQIFNRFFSELQQFRRFCPLPFDQAGRLTDQFLGRYNAVCDKDFSVLQSANYTQDTIQLWGKIYHKLDEFQSHVLHELENSNVDPETLKNIEKDVGYGVEIIDEQLKAYVYKMEQLLEKMYAEKQYEQYQYQQNGTKDSTSDSTNNSTLVQGSQSTETKSKISSILSTLLPPDFNIKNEIVNGTLADMGKSLLNKFTQ